MIHSRRDFMKLTLVTSLPFAFGTGSKTTSNSVIEGVRLGVQTYSFREMLNVPGDAVPRIASAIQQLGLSECEVFEPTIEPSDLWANAAWRVASGKPTQASIYGRPPDPHAPTAEEIATREALRKWRLATRLDRFKSIRDEFARAGVRIFAFNFLLKDDCTDDEVERGFEVTKALGANIMTASTTLTMAKRSVPFAEKHGIVLALHGHSNLSDPNQFVTPESFEQGLAMSKNYRINLDIGHFSAAGFDSVAFIRKYHDRITNLHLKDRKNNDGPNMPLGQGDTPIKPVLQLLKTERYAIPAYIEYEYAGGASTHEVARCLEYVRAALA